MSIIIEGFSDTDKVPGFVGETVFGAGPINLASIPMILLLIGLKTSAGSMTQDISIEECVSKEQADTLAGPGSELARMAYAALDEGSGFRLMLAPPLQNVSSVAATATITLATTSTSAGTFKYWIAGELIEVGVGASKTPTQAGDLVRDAINAKTRLPVTAANASGTITVTCKNASVRGNQLIIYQDVTSKPGAMTSVVTGGSAVLSSVANQTGCHFTGGTLSEDLTNVLANVYEGTYQRQAIAANDTTNLALVEAQIDDKAGPLQGRLEHVVVGHNDTQVAATSIAQTTLNNRRFQLVWLKNSEKPAAELAAAMASVRASSEGSNPNSSYDGHKFKTLVAQRYVADRVTRTISQSCLDNSVTPLSSAADGVRVVRAITTRSLDGTTPDYRTLDVGSATMPDYARDDFRLYWTTEFVVDNPRVAPDPGDSEPAAPSGVATPALWTAKANSRLLGYQQKGWITQVKSHPVRSEYNSTANRIMSAIPIIPTPAQHQIGVKILQFNVAA